VLDEYRGDGGAGRQRGTQLPERVARDSGRASPERPLGCPSSLGGIEPEVEYRRDQAGGAGAAKVEDHDLARLGVALDEQCFQDAQGTSAA
jgi:hypothetical protein